MKFACPPPDGTGSLEEAFLPILRWTKDYHMKKTTISYHLRNSQRIYPLLLGCAVFCLTIITTRAGSATWNLNPTSGDWNTAANWTPATVPDAPGDIATFASSNTTGVSLSSSTVVDRVVFAPGADAFTLTIGQSLVFTIAGAGITNGSGLTQNFAVTIEPGTFSDDEAKLRFNGHATIGDAVQLSNGGGSGGGAGGRIEFRNNSSPARAVVQNEGGAQNSAGAETHFFDNASASSATLINNGGADPVGVSGGGGGRTVFFGRSGAAQAAITNRAGVGPVAIGGSVTFDDDSTAQDATIVCEGAIGFGFGGATLFSGNASAGNALIHLESGSAGRGASLSFLDNATAANATIIADGGLERTGAIISFPGGDGGTARFILRHGAAILANFGPPHDTNFGSIEGSGTILVGSNNLRIGTNNASTRFSGRFRQGAFSSHGSITKVGSGTLELGGPSTHNGVNTVEAGTLLVNNRQGSGTGDGPVQVSAGTLGGNGTIGGEVRIGQGTAAAFLAPGSNGTDIGTLSLGDRITFGSHATYNAGIDSDAATADQVVVKNVQIESGALISVTDLGQSALLPGSTFTLIRTSNRPIMGQFANLPDGSTFLLGSNKFQANYNGGDGNDLTLSVVP